MDAGALALFTHMMTSTDTEEQMAATKAIWTLSFDSKARTKIKEEPKCVEALESLQKSKNTGVRRQAEGALWIVMEKDQGERCSLQDSLTYSGITVIILM